MDDTNRLIRDQFGANADKYAISAVHAQGTSLQRLIDLTNPQPAWHALDVSTGAGHTALAFAPHVAEVIACDLTPQMLDAARKLANERGITNIDLKPADAHQLPFNENTFDLVTNRIALHHYTDARKAIEEMARVCKPGGIVALTDNVVPPDKVTAGAINHFEKQRDPSHNWAYPLPRLEAMFTDTGLKVEHAETFSKEIEFEPWADRMSVSAEIKTKLRDWLFSAPPAVRDWIAPRRDGDKIFFTLHEAIIIGRKG